MFLQDRLSITVETLRPPCRKNKKRTKKRAVERFEGRLVHSHWSSSYITVLSLVESFIVLLAPAILCHKEPARASKAPIRIVGFHARKGPIIGVLTCHKEPVRSKPPLGALDA